MSEGRPHHEILNDPEFQALARARARITGVLTATTLLVYFGFIFFLAFRPDLFGTMVGENVTLGIPVGIGVIVLSCILTAIYVGWANSRYDTRVARLRARFGHPHAGDPPHG